MSGYIKDKDLRCAASSLYGALDHISRLASMITEIDTLSESDGNVEALAIAIKQIAESTMRENEI